MKGTVSYSQNAATVVKKIKTFFKKSTDYPIHSGWGLRLIFSQEAFLARPYLPRTVWIP